MSSNSEYEYLKSQYINTLPSTSTSQIKGTKTTFLHLNSFLKEKNLTFKDLLQSHNRESFREYLKGKVPNSSSRKVYWYYFTQFFKWLESNYLKIEPVSKESSISESPQKQPEAQAIEQKLALDSSLKPPCNYASLVTDKKRDTMIYCDNPKKKGLPKDHLIPISSCQVCWKRREWSFQKRRQVSVQVENREEAEKDIDLSKLPKIRKPIIHPINQVGVCENPILVRQGHDLTCVLCRKRTPQKWQACQEIQKELDTSPIAFDKFAKVMREKIVEESKVGEDPYWWWVAPKTEDMTLEEIEEELGLREPSQPKRISCSKFCSPLKIMNCEKYPSCDLNTGVSAPEEEPDLFDITEREAEPLRFREDKTITEDQPVSQGLFDSIRKRYHEVCETCEEQLHQRCTSYCNEFWEGLPSEVRTEALRLKHYPSEVTALREPLRERLQQIMPDGEIKE